MAAQSDERTSGPDTPFEGVLSFVPEAPRKTLTCVPSTGYETFTSSEDGSNTGFEPFCREAPQSGLGNAKLWLCSVWKRVAKTKLLANLNSTFLLDQIDCFAGAVCRLLLAKLIVQNCDWDTPTGVSQGWG